MGTQRVTDAAERLQTRSSKQSGGGGWEEPACSGANGGATTTDGAVLRRQLIAERTDTLSKARRRLLGTSPRNGNARPDKPARFVMTSVTAVRQGGPTDRRTDGRWDERPQLLAPSRSKSPLQPRIKGTNHVYAGRLSGTAADCSTRTRRCRNREAVAVGLHTTYMQLT